jgi:hypothetical protein
MIIEIKQLPRKRPGAPGNPPTVVVIKCDICGSTFERAGKYRTAYVRAKIHRCSKKCTYGHRKSDGFGGHGAAITKANCRDCGKLIERWTSQAAPNEIHGSFCKPQCYGSWKSKNPETYAIWHEKSMTPEARANISRTIRKKQKEGTYVHPWTGRKHSEESKKKMSAEQRNSNRSKGKNNPMYGKCHTVESKAIMSLKRAEMMLAGKIKPYGKNRQAGEHVSPKTGKKMFYRSGWELITMNFLDNDDNVASYGYETIKIPYRYNGEKRWYIPDFLVEFSDGTRQIWEVKPSMFINTEKVQQKALASRKFCESEGINEYRFITEHDLRELKIMS